MSVAGYSFHVLSDAFASHWGFQTLAQRPDWRARQQTDNNARFDEFAREVTARSVVTGCVIWSGSDRILSKNNLYSLLCTTLYT